MKIDPTKPLGAIARAARERSAAASYGETQRRPAAVPVDSVSLADIPEAELTPKVRKAIVALMEEAGALREQLVQSEHRIAYLERLAHQDDLLPIANRRAFVRELSRVISYSERYNEPASLVYFDLNGFKQINDEFGHAAGDATLNFVANTLLERVRESDTVGRLGGDEFGVILWRMDEEEAREKADELAQAISASQVEFEGHAFIIHTAYGSATFRAGKNAQQWIADADAAMYRLKAEMKAGDGG